ncbi:MAG TPA: DivIVA domain-containing protein [Acidimicrobiales bacterium]|nr:DivIVA domain-containing protein [Acidimicrobiales bacterium]
MPEDRPLTILSTSRMTPEEVARRTFTTTRRGFDPAAVRSFLDGVARELGAALEREDELRTALADAEHRAANPVLDEATLTASLGQETARVLRSAHEAATDLLARADTDAARIRAEAQEASEQIHSRAEQAASDRTGQADSAATEVRRRAQEEVVAKLEGVRLETEAMVAQARAECRAMVQEAQELRTRVLADLTKRRRILHSQIEQLRAGREKLAQAIGETRTSVNRIVEDVFRAEDEARLAAEAAGRQAAAQSEPEIEDVTIQSVAENGTEETVREASEGTALSASLATDETMETAFSDDESSRKQAVEELFARLRAEREQEPGPGQSQVANPADTPAETRAERADTLSDTRSDITAVHLIGRQDSFEDGPDAVRIIGPGGAGASKSVEPASDAVESDSDAMESEMSTAPARDPVFADRDDSLAPIVADLSRRLKRALQDDQNDILDRLRSKGIWSDDVLPTEEEHRQRYLQAGMTQLSEAARAGALFVGAGRPTGRRAEDIDAGVEAAASELAVSIVVPLRRRLADRGAALVEGDDAALTEHVGSAYREWKGARVERLAGDQAVAAFSAATMAAASDGVSMRWVVDDDGVECPDCDDNALAGSVALGEKFPTGHAHPPAHPGCRCIVAPVTA